MATGAERTVSNEGYTQAEWNLAQNESGDRVNFSSLPDKTVQVSGTFSGGTVTLEGSMDETNWETLTDFGGVDIVFSAAGMVVIRENPRSIRPVSSNTAGLTVKVIIGAANIR